MNHASNIGNWKASSRAIILDRQMLNSEKWLIYRAGTQRPTASKRAELYNSNNNNNANNILALRDAEGRNVEPSVLDTKSRAVH